MVNNNLCSIALSPQWLFLWGDRGFCHAVSYFSICRTMGIPYLLPCCQGCKEEATSLILSPTADPLSMLYLPRVMWGAGGQVVSGLTDRMLWSVGDYQVLCKALFCWTSAKHSPVIPDQCWIFPTHQSSDLAIDLSADTRWVSFDLVLNVATRGYWHHQMERMKSSVLQGCFHLGRQVQVPSRIVTSTSSQSTGNQCYPNSAHGFGWLAKVAHRPQGNGFISILPVYDQQYY